jgi:uncharacterized lipoprotein
MMKQLTMVLAVSFLLVFAACSGGDDNEKKRMYDAERKALEKAKQVESVLQEAEEKRLDEIEEVENNE